MKSDLGNVTDFIKVIYYMTTALKHCVKLWGRHCTRIGKLNGLLVASYNGLKEYIHADVSKIQDKCLTAMFEKEITKLKEGKTTSKKVVEKKQNKTCFFPAKKDLNGVKNVLIQVFV